MLNVKVQSSTVEENFVFGSPPLLNGFAYNTCRSQEGLLKVNHHECFNYNLDRPLYYDSDDLKLESSPIMKRKSCLQQQKFVALSSTRNQSNNLSLGNNYHNNSRNNNNNNNKIEYVTENLNQINIGNALGCHVDNGIKILEHAGLKVQQRANNETVFKKRKDLRVLKLALSNERFRQVAMKFGDGDEGGKEISESVHKTLRNENSTQVTCLYCKIECQVYENFPIVDGSLFLTPVNRSNDCIKFAENSPEKAERYMGFICVNCMEGKPKTLNCIHCKTPWKGSFFQIGTMYSYDILSATPCCEKQVSCKNCDQPVIDLSKGEASTLYFSYFSTKSTCPHCKTDDFHFVKPLSMFTLQDDTDIS